MESGKSMSYDDERENLVGWEGRGTTKGMKEKVRSGLKKNEMRDTTHFII